MFNAMRRGLILPCIWAVVLGAAMLTAPAEAPGAEKVRLAYTQTLYCPHVIIALEKGYFKKHGLEVETQLFTRGKLTLDAVMAGAADIATTAESPTTAAIMANRPIAFLARLIKARPLTLVNTEAGITTVADLKGKKVAITAGTGSEVYTYAVLRKAGLEPSDVTLVNLRPQDMPASIANGAVDAINTWEPHIHNATKAMGGKAKVLDTKGVYTETFNVLVMQDYLKGNKDTIAKVFKAFLDADEFIQANQQESIDILSRVVGMERKTVEGTWPNFDYKMALDDAVLGVLNAHAQWRLDTGNHPPGVSEVPDFKKWIFPEVMKSVAPDRVTLSGM
jgi:ABC-type nitrate/sulfonate/bicarbonate transport system substrate-binding protein